MNGPIVGNIQNYFQQRSYRNTIQQHSHVYDFVYLKARYLISTFKRLVYGYGERGNIQAKYDGKNKE